MADRSSRIFLLLIFFFLYLVTVHSHGNPGNVTFCQFNEILTDVIAKDIYYTYKCSTKLDSSQIYSVNVVAAVSQDVNIERVVDFSVSVHNSSEIIQSETWELPVRRAGKL